METRITWVKEENPDDDNHKPKGLELRIYTDELRQVGLLEGTLWERKGRELDFKMEGFDFRTGPKEVRGNTS